jgi:uncharacterized protein (UPF0335 family)
MLEDATKEILALKKQNRGLRIENDHLRNQLRDASLKPEAEMKNLAKEIANLNAYSQDLEDEIVRLNAYLQDLEDEIDGLMYNALSNGFEIRILKEENEGLRKDKKLLEEINGVIGSAKNNSNEAKTSTWHEGD